MMRCLLILLLLISPASWADTPGGPALDGIVVGVVDGDTVDLRLSSGMVRVRLHAIDTPERGQPYGRAARDALSGLVFGKVVQAEPFEQDRYDRLVATIWLTDMDVNAEMIRQGYAWTYRRYATDPLYCRYEQAAREQALGLWAASAQRPVAPWEWRQRRSLQGRFTDYSTETLEQCINSLGRR
jgi:micrococcal nuclease